MVVLKGVDLFFLDKYILFKFVVYFVNNKI